MSSNNYLSMLPYTTIELWNKCLQLLRDEKPFVYKSFQEQLITVLLDEFAWCENLIEKLDLYKRLQKSNLTSTTIEHCLWYYTLLKYRGSTEDLIQAITASHINPTDFKKQCYDIFYQNQSYFNQLTTRHTERKKRYQTTLQGNDRNDRTKTIKKKTSKPTPLFAKSTATNAISQIPSNLFIEDFELGSYPLLPESIAIPLLFKENVQEVPLWDYRSIYSIAFGITEKQTLPPALLMIRLKRLEKRRKAHQDLTKKISHTSTQTIKNYYNLIWYYDEILGAYRQGLQKKPCPKPHAPASYHVLSSLLFSHYWIESLHDTMQELLSRTAPDQTSKTTDEKVALICIDRICNHPNNMEQVIFRLKEKIQTIIGLEGDELEELRKQGILELSGKNWSKIRCHIDTYSNTVTATLGSEYLPPHRYYGKIILQVNDNDQIIINQQHGNIFMLIEMVKKARSRHPLFHTLMPQDSQYADCTRDLVYMMTAFSLAQSSPYLWSELTRAVHLANQQGITKYAENILLGQPTATNHLPIIIPEQNISHDTHPNQEDLEKLFDADLSDDPASMYILWESPTYKEFLENTIQRLYDSMPNSNSISTQKKSLSKFGTHDQNTINALLFHHFIFLKTYSDSSLTNKEKLEAIVLFHLHRKLEGQEKEKSLIIAKQLGIDVSNIRMRKKDFYSYPKLRRDTQISTEQLLSLLEKKHIVHITSLEDTELLLLNLYDHKDDLHLIDNHTLQATILSCIKVIRLSPILHVNHSILPKLAVLVDELLPVIRLQDHFHAWRWELLYIPVTEPTNSYSKLLTKSHFARISRDLAKKAENLQQLNELIRWEQIDRCFGKIMPLLDELYSTGTITDILDNMHPKLYTEDFYTTIVKRLNKRFPGLTNQSKETRWVFHSTIDHTQHTVTLHPPKLYALLYKLWLIHYSVFKYINPGIEITKEQKELGDRVYKQCGGLTEKCANLILNYSTHFHKQNTDKALDSLPAQHWYLFMPGLENAKKK